MAGNKERTFIMLKPDAVHRGLVGDIIKRFEQKGFKLVAMKFMQVIFIRFFWWNIFYPAVNFTKILFYFWFNFYFYLLIGQRRTFEGTLRWLVLKRIFPRTRQIYGFRSCRPNGLGRIECSQNRTSNVGSYQPSGFRSWHHSWRLLYPSWQKYLPWLRCRWFCC